MWGFCRICGRKADASMEPARCTKHVGVRAAPIPIYENWSCAAQRAYDEMCEGSVKIAFDGERVAFLLGDDVKERLAVAVVRELITYNLLKPASEARRINSHMLALYSLR